MGDKTTGEWTVRAIMPPHPYLTPLPSQHTAMQCQRPSRKPTSHRNSAALSTASATRYRPHSPFPCRSSVDPTRCSIRRCPGGAAEVESTAEAAPRRPLQINSFQASSASAPRPRRTREARSTRRARAPSSWTPIGIDMMGRQ